MWVDEWLFLSGGRTIVIEPPVTLTAAALQPAMVAEAGLVAAGIYEAGIRLGETP